jgi:hypothetical protein
MNKVDINAIINYLKTQVASSSEELLTDLKS